VAILQDDGLSDVRNWPVVAERADYNVADVTDNWVRFRSVETPTVPGQRYAVRLMAIGANIQPYKRNKDSNSYSGGRAYNADAVAQNFDMNITVFSDNDGTAVTMNKRTEGGGVLMDGLFAGKWGHTFVARGESLAAVDVWAAGANHRWDIDFTWKVYPAADPVGPTGPPIGPTKTTKAAYQTFGMGLHGVSYSPNEVRLVPGRSYFIEFAANNPPPDSLGFNPYVMDDDSYDQGMGYIGTATGWEARPSIDLAMTVVEYKSIVPVLLVEPESIQRRVFYTGNAAPAMFEVANAGYGTLGYAIQTNAAWCTPAPIAGDCTDETDTVTVTFNTTTLTLGSHNALITVTSPDAPDPRTVQVALQVDTVPPDFDRDTDVDVTDFGRLQECFSGPGIAQTRPDCLLVRLDLDYDADVDQDDVALFLACFSGPGIVANPDCAIP
jgi:hypothetical protein